MFGPVIPIVIFLLLIILVVGGKYIMDCMSPTKEGYVNSRKEDEIILKELQMRAEMNSKDKDRVERMFKAYWKVNKETSKDMVVNPFDSNTIPAWVQTSKDAEVLVPYIMPYMLGKTKTLPQTKEEALAEQFTNDKLYNDKTISLDQIDMMDDGELEESFKNQQLKDMTPQEAEKMAYNSVKNMANGTFDDKFYNSFSYVIMSFAQMAVPEAKPHEIRNIGVELKQKLPPAIQQIQMEARSLLRKVESAKRKENKNRKSMTLDQLRKKNTDSTFRLDREAYLKSLPESKRILMEGFTGKKEHFGLLDKIFSAILSPVIDGIVKGLMPLITSFISIAVKAFVSILPTIVNDVLIPLVNVTVKLITSIFGNSKLMDAIMGIIEKLVGVAMNVGWMIIKALSVPIITLFFKYVMPLVITAVRFVIFLARMATRLAITVWNLIVGFVKRNWSYVMKIVQWTITNVEWLLKYIYDFIQPYIAYALYIITPIALIGAILLIGPNLFQFLNNLIILGMTSTPERTFRPTQTLVDSASG